MESANCFSGGGIDSDETHVPHQDHWSIIAETNGPRMGTLGSLFWLHHYYYRLLPCQGTCENSILILKGLVGAIALDYAHSDLSSIILPWVMFPGGSIDIL
eukprot:scaffold2069_cov187-Amphora_coffeaeformis.AAC.21